MCFNMHTFAGGDAANHLMPVKMESRASKVAAAAFVRTEQPQFVRILKRYHDYKMVVDFT